MTGERGAPQVDEGEAVREGGSHSDRNITVAIFYNGYTDGCSTLPYPYPRAHLLYGIVEHASRENCTWALRHAVSCLCSTMMRDIVSDATNV